MDPAASAPGPDLTARPLAGHVEVELSAPPEALYDTWLERLDSWFVAPGTVALRAAVGEPFFFETHYDGVRHPHYGRFLRLDRPDLLEMTWVTGTGGTDGAETVLTVELSPRGPGTAVRLTHAGWLTEEARDANADAWPLVLAQLDRAAAADGDR